MTAPRRTCPICKQHFEIEEIKAVKRYKWQKGKDYLRCKTCNSRLVLWASIWDNLVYFVSVYIIYIYGSDLYFFLFNPALSRTAEYAYYGLSVLFPLAFLVLFDFIYVRATYLFHEPDTQDYNEKPIELPPEITQNPDGTYTVLGKTYTHWRSAVDYLDLVSRQN